MDINATIVVPGLATGSHDVALGNVAGNCTVAGSNPSAVAVTRGDTAQVSFAVACVATGIRITVATTGLDLDPDGYTVSLDGAAAVTLPLNGSVTISRMAAGAHQLTFGGRAANCTAGGTNPLSIDLPAGEIVAVGFPVTCVATGGVIEVTTATSGLDLDANGYLVQVDGGSAVAIGVNGTLRIPGIAGGSHEVTLGGAAGNCSIGDPNPRTVSITAGGLTRDTARTTFAVSCVATSGVIEVTTTTTGVDLDADGYTVELDGATAPPVVPVNGTIRVVGVSGGDHSVSLGAVAANCLVGGDDPRGVSITTGGLTRDTARTTFAVTCQLTTGAARIITATTRADLDPDGYWMAIDCYSYYGYDCYYYFFAERMAGNDTVIVAGVSTGDHMFELQQVAPNCSVAEANPRTVRVAGGTVTDVVFDVTCAALGSVVVNVSTAGVDLDPDGYTVAVVGPGYSTGGPIGVNESATFSAIPPGTASVTLSGVVTNCGVTSTHPLTVSIPSGGDATVAFAVDCLPATAIAFAGGDHGNLEIQVVNSNGTGDLRLTTHPGVDVEPAWSADGGKVAFRSNRDGNDEIYVMNADGSNPVRLTTNAAADYYPAWSPDGSKLAFVSNRDGNAEIYVMDANGGNVTRLTNDPAYDADPAWSPDGSRIAFVRGSCDSYYYAICRGNVYLINPDGSGATRLTTGDPTDGQPAWSPDGTRLAFSRVVSCSYYWCERDLFVMNADGSAIAQLTAGGDDHMHPAWSPGGSQIAFAAASCSYYYGCQPFAIHVVRSNGTNVAPVTGRVGSDPHWKP